MMNNGMYAPYYGNWRNRTFSDIFDTFETFQTNWNLTQFSEMEKELNLPLIYELLLAAYANSVTAASDENRFMMQCFSIIFQYGPSWQKELSVQKDLRALNVEDLRKGTVSIVNNASNPSGAPSTQNTNELPYVNEQNVSKSTRSLPDAYALLLSLLKKDVTQEFIDKFKRLFLTVVAPEEPLWYKIYSEEEQI